MYKELTELFKKDSSYRSTIINKLELLKTIDSCFDRMYKEGVDVLPIAVTPITKAEEVSIFGERKRVFTELKETLYYPDIVLDSEELKMIDAENSYQRLALVLPMPFNGMRDYDENVLEIANRKRVSSGPLVEYAFSLHHVLADAKYESNVSYARRSEDNFMDLINQLAEQKVTSKQLLECMDSKFIEHREKTVEYMTHNAQMFEMIEMIDDNGLKGYWYKQNLFDHNGLKGYWCKKNLFDHIDAMKDYAPKADVLLSEARDAIKKNKEQKYTK
jgi:hypothetical protein